MLRRSVLSELFLPSRRASATMSRHSRTRFSSQTPLSRRLSHSLSKAACALELLAISSFDTSLATDAELECNFELKFFDLLFDKLSEFQPVFFYGRCYHFWHCRHGKLWRRWRDDFAIDLLALPWFPWSISKRSKNSLTSATQSPEVS